MIYIEAPEKDYLFSEYMSHVRYRSRKSIFLAGGIMMCPPWQDEMIKLLEDTSLIILNPRRKNFPMDDPSESDRQIEWEFKHLGKADAVLYWFSPPTNNPIVFYELGRHIETKKVFVGVHPDFERKQDVYTQVGLVKPNLYIVNTLQQLATQVIEWNGAGEWQKQDSPFG